MASGSLPVVGGLKVILKNSNIVHFGMVYILLNGFLPHLPSKYWILLYIYIFLMFRDFPLFTLFFKEIYLFI